MNAELVWQAVLCCFTDLTRTMTFHSIGNPAREKQYAYKAFWLLKHHPVQIVDFKGVRTADFEQLDADIERLVYVNEFIVTR